MEQPILRLGLLGFSSATESSLTQWVQQPAPGWPGWCTVDPHRADAWLVDGSAVEVLGRDEVLIRHPRGQDGRFALNRAEVDRPLAFSVPLPDGFASAESFDAHDEHSVRLRLQRFEAWLRPLRTQFTLGALLVPRLGQHRGIIQLKHADRLLAVLDFERWQAGVSIPARPVDLVEADWIVTDGARREPPPAFVRLPLHRVLWNYAVRTAADVLPNRYRERTVYLRRVPRLPPHWFEEGHLLLMRELLQAPADHAGLVQRTGWPQALLSHRLAALYYAGGLTTDAESARRAEGAARRALLHLQLDPNDPMDAARARHTPPETGPPSSLLREALHSPLRAVPLQPPQTPS